MNYLNQKENLKAIVLVNGAGLGNAVRVCEILNELDINNIEYDLFCSGNAIEYFKSQKFNCEELKQLKYGIKDGNLSILKTFSITNIKQNFGILNDNNNKIKSALSNNDYDFAIVDSFYSIKHLKKKNIPIYSVNNSNLLYEKYFMIKNNINLATTLHFKLIEKLDYWFNIKNVKRAFSLTFINAKPNKIFLSTPLISRSGIATNIENNNILFMLSGSNWKTSISILNTNNWLSEIDNLFVVGIDKEKIKSKEKNIKLVGRTFNNIPYINTSKIAVINSGFSAISEMIVAKKPMVIIPLENHSEQYFNAYIIEKMGLGIVATINNWEDKSLILLNNFEKYKDNFSKIEPFYVTNGAKFIVKQIKKDLIMQFDKTQTFMPEDVK